MPTAGSTVLHCPMSAHLWEYAEIAYQRAKLTHINRSGCLLVEDVKRVLD